MGKRWRGEGEGEVGNGGFDGCRGMLMKVKVVEMKVMVWRW